MFKSVKKFGRLFLWFYGVIYDFIRFFRYGGWTQNLKNKDVRNYYVSKVYHSLEKSLSFKNRNINSGWNNAKLLVDILSGIENEGDWGYHDVMAYYVLNKYLDESINANVTKTPVVEYVIKRFKEINKDFSSINDSIEFGTKNKSRYDLDGSKYIDAEYFFNNRYSVREFSEEKVEQSLIYDAIRLSLKTPSACNRQPWHVYHISERHTVYEILKFQSGNKGFSEKIQQLLIVCTDIRAFNSGSERYQHWIDGGMYSMSLVYTLHALGISSCCLNWSELRKQDVMLRKHLPLIHDSHTIMMLIAIGYADSNNTLCVSPRRPLNEIYTVI